MVYATNFQYKLASSCGLLFSCNEQLLVNKHVTVQVLVTVRPGVYFINTPIPRRLLETVIYQRPNTYQKLYGILYQILDNLNVLFSLYAGLCFFWALTESSHTDLNRKIARSGVRFPNRERFTPQPLRIIEDPLYMCTM